MWIIVLVWSGVEWSVVCDRDLIVWFNGSGDEYAVHRQLLHGDDESPISNSNEVSHDVHCYTNAHSKSVSFDCTIQDTNSSTNTIAYVYAYSGANIGTNTDPDMHTNASAESASNCSPNADSECCSISIKATILDSNLCTVAAPHVVSHDSPIYMSNNATDDRQSFDRTNSNTNDISDSKSLHYSIAESDSDSFKVSLSGSFSHSFTNSKLRTY